MSEYEDRPADKAVDIAEGSVMDWSNDTTDRKEPQEQSHTEPTVNISQTDWRMLMRFVWCAAMDTRDTALSLLLVRDQLKASEGRLLRISLLPTVALELMLKEIKTEREKIKQWVKPAFPPMQKEILKTIETMIRSEIVRRKYER